MTKLRNDQSVRIGVRVQIAQQYANELRAARDAAIIRRVSNGERQSDVARDLGCTPQIVHNVLLYAGRPHKRRLPCLDADVGTRDEEQTE